MRESEATVRQSGSAEVPLPPGVADLVPYEITGPPRIHRGLPSATLTLILALEEPLETAWQSDAQISRRSHNWTLLSNLHTQPAYVVQPRRQVGVQLALHPLAARRILGCPAAALTDGSCEASQVAGAWLAELRERVEANPTPGRRRLIDESISRAWDGADHAPRVRAEVVRAWRLLDASGGLITVRAIAADVGLSERRLAALFAAEVGRSPKTVAQLIRFQRAVRMIKATSSLAEVGACCGFSDQSHLDRAFRGFAGCSPSSWAAEEGIPLTTGFPIRPSQSGNPGAE